MAAVVASKAQLSALDDLMPTDDDLLYEEELLRNPYSLKMWWRYIQARTDASARRRYVLYERALKALPGSYKVRRVVLALAAMLRALGDRRAAGGALQGAGSAGGEGVRSRARRW